jgi:hypothetical protein
MPVRTNHQLTDRACAVPRPTHGIRTPPSGVATALRARWRHLALTWRRSAKARAWWLALLFLDLVWLGLLAFIYFEGMAQ